jgi:UDP-N-acetylmuramate-alanine ligase
MRKSGSKPEFIANYEDISSIIMSNANKGDLIVMMGAGSISSWAYQLPNKFSNII